ncbi:CO3-like protein, partial [Mya arenaria]
MKVTAENVIQYQELAGPKKKDQKPTHVTMVADFPDGSQSSREIVIGYKSGYLIVQTDKPLYTPREDVNVRVLAMDESLKPILDQNVYIDIRTPSSDVAGGAEVMTVDRKTFTGSKTGFYRHKFSLPPYPQIGEWTIRAYLPGKYDTETIVPFEVKEFVLPTFGVKITSSDEYILEDMEEVKVKIDATYVYGKKVQGSAGLQFSIVEDNGAKNEVFTKTRNDLINGLTEFTIDVGDLIDARGGGFPENARLLLEADVIEDATGKEEKSSEDFLVFTKSPFRFDLSRSKNTYRPGMSYYLKIDMTFVNGRTAAKQRIKIRYYEENEEKQMAKDEYITNDKGQLMEPVSTGNHQQQLHFHIVSRGEIVYNKFNVPTNEINMRMENDIPQKISPGARLLAFYVDTNGDAIVADSTKFAVDPMCRGEPLTLKTEETTLDPGATGKLTVTGPSDMWVGFNIMDKALLLLNSDNILKHDTIFQALDSHDLGCGAGSGMNAEEIFKNAGLTILTNANADQAALRRTSEHCDKAKRRRRRSASPLKCHPKMHNCCEIGELLADGLLEWKDNQLDHRNIVVDLNPREDCMAKAMAIRRKKHITHECITSIYKFCLEKLASELRDQGLEGRSIFADDEQYKKDVNALIELGSFLTKRSNFETSFFFEEHQLSQGGPLKRSVKFRDSITEWSVQAIGLSATEGACIAESVDVKTFKKFFIQLDLPYKATRFEHPVHGDRPARTYNLDLALPKTALTGTGSATAYVESNIMDAVVATLLDGVDKMFTEPKYCGEQTMIMTAPIVYGMHYLKQTGQETAENEQQGTAWIKIGISREISEFQKIDGSYGAWQHWPTSLLTAFVAKVFCQAEKVVDGVVVKESLQRTLNYIANNQKGTGYFVDNNPVIHKEMQPVQDAVSNAQSYLEVLPAGNFQNKYLLAITTYALALSNSKHKGTFKNLLLEAVTERENMMYWSDHDGNEATAADVETTAYALLAFLKFDDIRTSGKIVTWLTGQRKAIGVWYTTQDTVVALQALAEYSVRTYNREVNLDIEIRNDQTLHKVSVTNDNALLQKVIPELLVKGTNNQFKVTVSGSGTARMNIELRWNRKALPNEKCYFDVSPIEINEVNPAFAGSSKDRPCNVCGRCPGDDIDNENEGIDYNDVDDAIHNRRKKREADVETPQKCVTFEVKTVDDDKSLMSIVKVNLETDVKAIEDDFKELMTNGVIDRYEMPEDGKSFVIFYINEISQVPRKFIFRLEDNFQGSTVSRQPATVVVYDYYKPGQCSSPVDEELFDYTVKFSKLSRDKKAQTTKPTDMVANYACNLEKANFVYKVTIEETTFDAKVNMRYATAVIDSVILAGKENQNPDDEITLEWKLMCKHPDLKVGKTYYIVGKDPTIYNGDN